MSNGSKYDLKECNNDYHLLRMLPSRMLLRVALERTNDSEEHIAHSYTTKAPYALALE
jgi:hypothetical protein